MASLNNTLIFKECLHTLEHRSRVTEHSTSNVIEAVGDNDYSTFSDIRDYNINIADGSEPSRVDAVFVKSKGVTRYNGIPTGGSGTGWTQRQIRETIVNYEGDAVDTTVDGFQHDLFLLPSHFTATSVRLQFTGSNIEIYEIMLLELGIEIDANESGFLEIQPVQVDRTGGVDTSDSGQLSRGPGDSNARHRRNTDVTIQVIPGVSLMDNVDAFLFWLEDNPHFVIVEEFTRFPKWCYPAVNGSTRIEVRCLTDFKPNGYAVPFRILER